MLAWAIQVEETATLKQAHLQLGQLSPNFSEDTFGYTS